MTLTRIIDWVSTWSEENFESSSDPSSRTVNEPGVRAAALGDGDALLVSDEGEGVGDAMVPTCPVASHASFAAGRKYARLPAIADRTTAKTARVAVRVALRRPRDLRARRPGRVPSGTGQHSSQTARLALLTSCLRVLISGAKGRSVMLLLARRAPR